MTGTTKIAGTLLLFLQLRKKLVLSLGENFIVSLTWIDEVIAKFTYGYLSNQFEGVVGLLLLS